MRTSIAVGERRRMAIELMMARGIERKQIVERARAELGIGATAVDRYSKEIRTRWERESEVRRPERRAQLHSIALDCLAEARADHSHAGVASILRVLGQLFGVFSETVEHRVARPERNPAGDALWAQFELIAAQSKQRAILLEVGQAPEVRPEEAAIEGEVIGSDVEMTGEVAEEHLVSTDGADVGVEDGGDDAGGATESLEAPDGPDGVGLTMAAAFGPRGALGRAVDPVGEPDPEA
jgi:hypothetical protein